VTQGTTIADEQVGFAVQVAAREAVLVATAQPITKDLADLLAHTAAIHSKSFAKRRLAPCNCQHCCAQHKHLPAYIHDPTVAGIQMQMQFAHLSTLRSIYNSAQVSLCCTSSCLPASEHVLSQNGATHRKGPNIRVCLCQCTCKQW